MLFDPEAGKTAEQILEIMFRRNPGLRTYVEELAQAHGQSMQDFAPAFVTEALAAHDEQMKDPTACAAYHARMDRKEAPYGVDPLLRKNP